MRRASFVLHGGIIYGDRLRNADTDRFEKIVNRLRKNVGGG